MNLKNIYDCAQNPINSDEVMDALINAYSEKTYFKSNFYGYINRIYSQLRSPYNPTDRDTFLSTVFNLWKQNVGQPLKTYFADTPEATTVQGALDQIPSKKWLYFVDNFLNSKHYWTYINSNEIHDKSSHEYPYPFNVEHRLYININTVATHKLGLLFLKKCEQQNLPYLFKFSDKVNTDDNFIVYTDSQHLPNYYKILTDIKKENPELEQYISRPPILSSLLDEWIGYESESYDKDTPFNLTRINIINSAFDEALQDAIFTDPELTLTIEGEDVSLIDEVSWRIVEKQIDYLTKLERKVLKSYYGLNPRDLSKNKFLDTFFEQVKNHMLSTIHDKSVDIPTLHFSYNDKGSTTIDIKQESFQSALLSIFPDIIATYPLLKQLIREKIMNRGEEKGIDRKNFSFASHIVQTLSDKTKQPLWPVSDERFHNTVNDGIMVGYMPVTRINKTVAEIIRKRKKKDSGVKPNTTTDKSTQPNEAGQVNNSSTYGLKKEKIKQDLPISSKAESRFQHGMSEEEIIESRIKLGFITSDMDASTTYRLTKKEIIQDLPISSVAESKFQHGMSEEEIAESRAKILSYKKTK